MPDYLLEATFYVALLAAAVRIATPLLFAALGETIAERSGVLNIGLEGTLLAGAWAAFMGMYFSGSGAVGVLAAMLMGMAITAILGYVCISRQANQIIAGIVLNIVVLGLTSFVFRRIFNLTLPNIGSFPPLPVPVLSDIPYIGQVLFRHTVLVYAAFLTVPVVAFLLYRTHFGLCLRAVGEHPAAVDTAGINVIGIRYGAVLLSGLLAGAGGAALSIGQLSQFTDNLTAGRGFIALAIVLLGRWDPFRVMLSALLFAGADAVQLRLQVLGFVVAKEILGMIPYVVAIAAMAVFVGKLRMPTAIAQPYIREHAG